MHLKINSRLWIFTYKYGVLEYTNPNNMKKT